MEIIFQIMISDEQIDKNLKDSNLIENLLNSFKKVKELLKLSIKSEEGVEVQTATQINFIPDCYDLFKKFSMNGISMTKKELMLLNKSLSKFATILTNGNITFFVNFLVLKKIII